MMQMKRNLRSGDHAFPELDKDREDGIEVSAQIGPGITIKV
jgi:hypothetical protein